MAAGRKRGYIGSMNVDTGSTGINSGLGVIVESPRRVGDRRVLKRWPVAAIITILAGPAHAEQASAAYPAYLERAQSETLGKITASAAVLSQIRVTSMPACMSSQVVSRAPCSSGRVSSA